MTPAARSGLGVVATALLVPTLILAQEHPVPESHAILQSAIEFAKAEKQVPVHVLLVPETPMDPSARISGELIAEAARAMEVSSGVLSDVLVCRADMKDCRWRRPEPFGALVELSHLWIADDRSEATVNVMIAIFASDLEQRDEFWTYELRLQEEEGEWSVLHKRLISYS